MGEVDKSQLSIRSGPGTNFPTLGALPQGSQVMLFPGETDDGWSQVAVSLGGKPSLGWVRRVFIKPLKLSSAPAAEPPASPKPKVADVPSPTKNASAPPKVAPTPSSKPKVADVPSPTKNASAPPTVAPTPSPKPKVADVPSPGKNASAPPAAGPIPSPKPKVAAVPSPSKHQTRSSSLPAAEPTPSQPQLADVPSSSKIAPLNWVRGLFKRPDNPDAPPAAGSAPPSEKSALFAPGPTFLRPLSVTRSDLACGESFQACRATIELTYKGPSGVNGALVVDCKVSTRLERKGDGTGSSQSFSGSDRLYVSHGYGRATMTIDFLPGPSTQDYAAVQLSDVACSHR